MLCAILEKLDKKNLILVTPAQNSIRFYRGKAYTLSGTLANDGEKGIIIKNGKKTIK